MSEITQILSAIQAGDPNAAAQLLPLVYDELRRLAAQRLVQEQPGQTLQPTALVHEAYLRLVGGADGPYWDHRGHFFAAAAEAMRRILIDNARRKLAVRHGGDRRRVPLEDCHAASQPPDELIALDEALAAFAAKEPAKAELVKMLDASQEERVVITRNGRPHAVLVGLADYDAEDLKLAQSEDF